MWHLVMFQTLRGQRKVRAELHAGKQNFKDREKGNTPQEHHSRSTGRDNACLPLSAAARAPDASDSPVSGRGQKCSALRAPLGLPHGDPVARAGKFPQRLVGHFLARITAVLTLGRLGLGTPHCCHKATGSAGICKYRLPPTGVMSSAQC